MSDIWPGGGAEKDEMDSYGFPRLDPERAERLLAGRSAIDAAGEPDRLALMLAAAAAPGRAAELAGEQAALAAFRSAVPVVSQQPAGPLGRWRRLLAFKVAALAVALTAGGVALAAGAGLVPGLPGLPGPSRYERPPVPPASVSSASLPTTTAPDGSPAPARTPAPTGGPGASATQMSTEAVQGQCQAYLAAPRGERGKALERSKLAELATLAGGEEQIEAYCVAVLAGQKPVKPSKSAHPTGQPDQQPNAVTTAATPEPVAS